MKVLIAEDNAYKTQLLVEALSDCGVSTSSIIVAANAYETRCALRDNAGLIDLLLLDLVLPNRSGDTPMATVGLGKL